MPRCWPPAPDCDGSEYGEQYSSEDNDCDNGLGMGASFLCPEHNCDSGACSGIVLVDGECVSSTGLSCEGTVYWFFPNTYAGVEDYFPTVNCFVCEAEGACGGG